jgi:dihydroneopterin aldolase
MAELDCITLRNMQFHIVVGILPHEREHPQPLEVDLTVWLPAGRGAVLDYRALHDAARAAVVQSRREYLEEIADAVARRALAMDGVARVGVRVRKPQVSLGAPLDFVEVSIQRPADA